LYVLNEDELPISFGTLEYTLKFTRFASTKQFPRLRDDLLRSSGGHSRVDVEIPTPLPVTRKFGQWVVGPPLGRGGHGRVFQGTNTKDDVVALKIMAISNSRDRTSVNQEVHTNEILTDIANKEDDGGRILRQIGVIGGPDDDEIVSVHEPVAFDTLGSLVGGQHSG